MKINNIEIKDETLDNYIIHFNKSKNDLFEWESTRKELHEAIFNEVKIKRISDAGKVFSDALDKHCIPLIEKSDYFVAGLKRIGIAKNESEMTMTAMHLDNQRRMEQIQKDKEEKTKNNNCRICNKDLADGIARINDHLVPDGINGMTLNQAICLDCSNNNPDEYHLEFKKIYH